MRNLNLTLILLLFSVGLSLALIGCGEDDNPRLFRAPTKSSCGA